MRIIRTTGSPICEPVSLIWRLRPSLIIIRSQVPLPKLDSKKHWQVQCGVRQITQPLCARQRADRCPVAGQPEPDILFRNSMHQGLVMRTQFTLNLVVRKKATSAA